METENKQVETGNMQNEEDKWKKEVAKAEKKEAQKKKKLAKKEKAAVKKRFDFEKARIALERLQLNWVKWNITCVALGFTAYKFNYSRIHEEKNPANYFITGREIGILLILIGIVSLLIAVLQHKKNIANLKLQYETMPYSVSLVLSYIVMVFSLIIIAMAITRT